jgi:hypothetical protein
MGDGIVLSIQAGTDKNQSVEEKRVDICFLFLSAIQKTKTLTDVSLFLSIPKEILFLHPIKCRMTRVLYFKAIEIK